MGSSTECESPRMDHFSYRPQLVFRQLRDRPRPVASRKTDRRGGRCKKSGGDRAAASYAAKQQFKAKRR